MKKQLFLAAFLFTASATAAEPHVPLGVFDLRCEGMENPADVGTPAPSFSWKISSSVRGTMQYAYQILVSSSPLTAGQKTAMWNSGRIVSDRNTFVRYRGKPLQPGHRYYWKVKIWAGGDSAVSGTATFLTGLWVAADWGKAEWIGFEQLPDSLRLFPGDPNVNRKGPVASKRAVVPYFRRTFSVRKPVAAAYAFVCGLGQYKLYVNGRREGADFLDPAWSDYTRTCYYNSFDITRFIHPGENAIGAIVAPGFLYINKERYRKLIDAIGYPMLKARIVIYYRDGTTENIVTDTDWKTAPSPVTYSGIYGGEDYDARLVMEGWDRAGFDDRRWKRAIQVKGPGGQLLAQPCYSLRVDSVFAPRSVTGGKIRVYDFGQNASGIIRLKARGEKGYSIRITPAELLGDKGLPDQHATGKPYYFSYTFSGKGTETWQPSFSYYGFRYAGVQFFNPAGNEVAPGEDVQLDSLWLLHTQNAAPRAGAFSCSDSLLNKIFRLILWGIDNNMASVATDCPHREKLGWLEQSHLMGPSIRYNYDILTFYRKIIRDMRDAQLPTGLVPDIAPEYVVFSDGFRDSPEWGSAAVLLPWYLYEWYGDSTTLAASYPTMKKYVSWLQSRSHDHLLFYGLGDWLAVAKPATPEGLTASAFYFYDAAVLAGTARVLGKEKDERIYSVLQADIRRAFNERFFHDSTCTYGSGSQTSFALPLYMGIVEDRFKRQVLRRFIESIEASGCIQTAGDIGNRFLIQALNNNGASWLLYKIEDRDSTPGYGYQLARGATSLAEAWDASRDLSQDHMGMGHLMEWFYNGLGGIGQQKGSVGFKKILIAPRFIPQVNEVGCSYRSIQGDIGVSWQRQGPQVLLNVRIPANTTAKIQIPADNHMPFTESGRPLDRTTIAAARVDRETVLSVGSGHYHFRFELPDGYFGKEGKNYLMK